MSIFLVRFTTSQSSNNCLQDGAGDKLNEPEISLANISLIKWSKSRTALLKRLKISMGRETEREREREGEKERERERVRVKERRCKKDVLTLCNFIVF